jgi:hypothetical protein
VDLNAGAVERHAEPSPDGYRLTARAGRGEALTSVALPKVIFTVDVVLG